MSNKTTVNENHKVGDIYEFGGEKFEYLGRNDGSYDFKPLGDSLYFAEHEGVVPFIIFPEPFKKVEK